MARKIARVKNVGTLGEIMPQGVDVGYWDFLYQKSTVINPNFYPGDRVVLPDGRVFRYGREHASTDLNPLAVEAGTGICGTGNLSDDGVSASTNRAQVVGDRELRFASQTFAKDELRGGYVVIYSTVLYQQAGIIGNNACSSSALTVYLDRPLNGAVTSSQFCEILPNPYYFLGRDADSYNSVLGIPMVTPSTAEYFWLQTWGPLWVNPGASGGIGGGGGERQVVFWVDGTLRLHDNSYKGTQHAGFILNMDSSGNVGPPFIMLQISP